MLFLAPFALYVDVHMPLIDDAAEFTIGYIPTSFERDGVGPPVLQTVYWWLRVISLALKQIADPYLKFDEVTLAVIAVWNTCLTVWDASLEYAYAFLILQIPWMAFLWAIFDGDFED